MADVFIGGVQGFSSLDTPAAVSALLATGRVGLYQHALGLVSTSADGTLPGIVSAFANTGPGIAELGYESNAANWFSNDYTSLYTNYGLAPTEALIDINGYTVDPGWSSYVSAAQANGISIVAPIFSPNFADSVYGNFATMPQYAGLRAAAILGGGIALDCPPGYAAEEGSAYVASLESEISWAHANGLVVTAIISPHDDFETTFLQDTESFLSQLAVAGTLPDNYVVETYATYG